MNPLRLQHLHLVWKWVVVPLCAIYAAAILLGALGWKGGLAILSGIYLFWLCIVIPICALYIILCEFGHEEKMDEIVERLNAMNPHAHAFSIDLFRGMTGTPPIRRARRTISV